MFTVPELSKKRLRPIKHTFVANKALGKETLLPCPLPTKQQICNLVHHGEVMVSFDFASYFDAFRYSDEVSKLFCFRHANRLYRLKTLAMGQRQAVEVAQAATELLIDFPKSCRALAYIDNVIFVGSRDQVLRDASEFVRRVRLVGGTLNDASDNLEALFSHAGDWCGVALDLSSKSVKLTDKILLKLQTSFARCSDWSLRNFAAHVGLLFWAWGILDIPMPEFFPLLRFVSKVGRELLDAPESAWDQRADIWPSALPSLHRWTELALANLPRPVPSVSEPEWLMEVDASAWGWGYFALNRESGEVRMHGEPWSPRMRSLHGEKFLRSTFAEPHGIHNALCHLLSTKGPRRVRVGTDSSVASASFTRGFNTHSFDINEVLRANRAAFGPHFVIEFLHVPGTKNVADSLSRGGPPMSAQDIAEARDSLRRMLGPDKAPLTLSPPALYAA
jgi:hypothetical protein